MRRTFFRKLNIFLIFFFGASTLTFFVMNGGAYARQIRYAILLRLPFVSSDLRQGNILEVAARADGVAEGEYQLLIPKIGLSAPIVIPRGNSGEQILASLEEGVGLYPGSSAPGEEHGRTILLGHSSRASWYLGGYETVFSLLPQLEEGDEFSIKADGVEYTYRVFEKQFLSPSRTNEVLAGPVSGSEVDLITCYPIGSASERTLVRASLIRTERI